MGESGEPRKRWKAASGQHCTYSSQWPSVRGFVHASGGKPEALVALWNAVYEQHGLLTHPRQPTQSSSLLKG